MIDSGTTPHVSPRVDTVDSKTGYNVTVTLAVDSTIKVTERGIRNVTFLSSNCPQKLRIPVILVVHNASMSLLSLPPLTRTGIGILFIPG